MVLKAPDVPSVLVELGYVSNKADLKSLTSEAWRDRDGGFDRPGDRYILHHAGVAGGRPELSGAVAVSASVST